MISLLTYPLVFPGEIDKNENFFGKLIMEESDISDPFATLGTPCTFFSIPSVYFYVVCNAVFP